VKKGLFGLCHAGYWLLPRQSRITVQKDHEVTDEAAHDLVIRSVDVGVCANSYIPGVLKRWREPQYEAFEDRNVWSLLTPSPKR
jgi:hypothetical protein